MKRTLQIINLLLATGSVTLAACGGGEGGGIASAPPPPAAPAKPAAPPPIPPAPIGLQSAQPFKTYSVWVDGWGSISSKEGALEFSYSAADGLYTIKLPSTTSAGTLQPKGGNGSHDENGWLHLESTNNEVIPRETDHIHPSVRLDWPGSSKYSYANFGSWSGSRPMGEDQGFFAYGIPTAVGNMPTAGNASYSGEVKGVTNGEPATESGSIGALYGIQGKVALFFDFAAGTLSGEMKPEIPRMWDAPLPLGTYLFRDTIFSSGSNEFSGKFIVSGSSADSFFVGSFVGPQGAELMANWQAPFQLPGTDRWGTMAGIWIAKKD